MNYKLVLKVVTVSLIVFLFAQNIILGIKNDLLEAQLSLQESLVDEIKQQLEVCQQVRSIFFKGEINEKHSSY